MNQYRAQLERQQNLVQLYKKAEEKKEEEDIKTKEIPISNIELVETNKDKPNIKGKGKTQEQKIIKFKKEIPKKKIKINIF